MTDAPNRNTLWGQVFIDELVAAGIDAVCVAPGSRSTPLVVAAAANDDLHIYSHLDERSAAYFALGRARRTGRPTPVITTSGTAAAELHPAVLEADRSRVPFIALTADRPPVLRDSGANQTVDQVKLYGDAVRWFRDLPEPAAESRKLGRLRTDAARAVAEARGPEAGPVHVNVPFAKPLAPEPVPGDVPANLADDYERPGPRPAVTVTRGRPTIANEELATLADEIAAAERGLLVCGPLDPFEVDPAALVGFAEAAGFPVIADPLSGVRFGSHVTAASVPILGGYDAYLDPAVTDTWPDPDLVTRVGASPTSKSLRRYLRRTGSRQLLVDPAGGWREAEFATSDLLVADPGWLAGALAARLDRSPTPAWHERWERADAVQAELLDEATPTLEGRIVAETVAGAPDPSTIVVSNSMPVRDLDRFCTPSGSEWTVLGNRGTSGIDGVTSTALGAGAGTEEPLVVILGDLAAYHDMNGLLALGRCGLDATIVVINNDGGGIFHALPIADFDPPFTEQFRTPHGLTFGPAAELYGLAYDRVEPEGFGLAYREALETDDSVLLEVETDASASHAERDALQARLIEALMD